MEERNIYHDISERTNGDIYIGVEMCIRDRRKSRSSGSPGNWKPGFCRID